MFCIPIIVMTENKWAEVGYANIGRLITILIEWCQSQFSAYGRKHPVYSYNEFSTYYLKVFESFIEFATESEQLAHILRHKIEIDCPVWWSNTTRTHPPQ